MSLSSTRPLRWAVHPERVRPQQLWVAVEDAVESQTPALGYTVTYAVGNTLLIIWGVVIVLLMT